MQEHNQRGEVVTTASIPLWARAVEQQRPNPILVDKLAPSILAAAGFDTSAYSDSIMSQVGCCIRAMLIDRIVETFAARHTPCVAIQLGAGLDARFQRLTHPEHFTQWYDLDLPEAIALRRKIIPPPARNEYIAESLFSESWMEQLAKAGLPVIIIIEGVVMYFSDAQMHTFFNALATHFPQGAQLAMDLVPPMAIGRGKYHDSVKKAGKSVEFTWTVEPSAFDTLNPRLHCEEVYYLTDHDYTKRFPWMYRAACRIPKLRRMCNQRVVSVRLAPLGEGKHIDS